MTPEFDRRSAVVLASPYWDEGNIDEQIDLLHKRSELRDAIIDAGN